MAELHDDDLFQIQHGENPIFAQFLDTNGRTGWRIMDKYGRGILLERDAMERFCILLQIALGHTDTVNMEQFIKGDSARG